MSGRMINFRMSDGDVAALDAAAARAGMTRSDWIRHALTVAVNQTASTPATVTPAPKVCPQGGGAKCPTAAWVKLPTGVSLCTTCGVKRGH